MMQLTQTFELSLCVCKGAILPVGILQIINFHAMGCFRDFTDVGVNGRTVNLTYSVAHASLEFMAMDLGAEMVGVNTTHG